jgi:hypothetical protein
VLESIRYTPRRTSSFELKLEAFGRLVATPQRDPPNVADSVRIGSIETVADKDCRASLVLQSGNHEIVHAE